MRWTTILLTCSILIVLGCLTWIVVWYGIERYKTLNIPYDEDSMMDNSKKRKILVFQCGAYPNPPEFLDLTQKINRAYCNKWGYEYKYLEHSLEDMPPYWLKVNDTHSMMQEDNYDYVMYVDADAIFYNDEISIDGLINYVDPNEKYLMLVGKDMMPFKPVNAGVFLVKRDLEGKGLELVSKWLYTCFKKAKDPAFTGNCDSWKLHAEKWNCDGCRYAQANYEQGQLAILRTENPDTIGVLRRQFLSNSNPRKRSFMLHMMGAKDDERAKVFREYLDTM